MIQFDPEGHIYRVDGVVYPSVTEIIDATVPKPFERAAWFGYRTAQQGRRLDDVRNEAAARGTKVHKILADAALGKGLPDPFDVPGLEGYLEAIDRFLTDNEPEFAEVEEQVYSDDYQYAGTLDGFCTFRAGKYRHQWARYDAKTGRVYPESHFPQLAAYDRAAEERGYGESDVRLVLDLKPTGKYRLVESVDTFEDFLVLKRHWDSIQRRKEKRKKK